MSNQYKLYRQSQVPTAQEAYEEYLDSLYERQKDKEIEEMIRQHGCTNTEEIKQTGK